LICKGGELEFDEGETKKIQRTDKTLSSDHMLYNACRMAYVAKRAKAFGEI